MSLTPAAPSPQSAGSGSGSTAGYEGAGDRAPGRVAQLTAMGVPAEPVTALTEAGEYRTLDYVLAECAKLARQLAEATGEDCSEN